MSLIGEKVCYAISYYLLSKNSGRYQSLFQIANNVKSFENWRAEVLKISLDYFLERIMLKDKTVLDFGCGGGNLSFFLKKKGAGKVYGVDLGYESLCRAKELNTYGSSVEFVSGTTNTIPLPSESIDLIFCISVLEHVIEVDSMLKEWYRVLRPGGQVLIQWSAWHHPDSAHLGTVIPIPYAQCLFSERTLARTAGKIKLSDKYKACWWDIESKDGLKKAVTIQDEYTKDFLNKMSIKEFNLKIKRNSSFHVTHYECHVPKWLPYIRPLLKIPFLREHLTSYVSYILTKPVQVDNLGVI